MTYAEKEFASKMNALYGVDPLHPPLESPAYEGV